MEFPETNLPNVCRNCIERTACLSGGEGEHCCDECDHLLERFHIPLSSKKGLSLSLDPDLYAQLAVLAKKQNLSIRQYVTALLAQHVKFAPPVSSSP